MSNTPFTICQRHPAVLYIRLIVVAMVMLISQSAHAEPYVIEKIKGDIYRFVDDRHRSVFLVTDEGILLVDTIDAKAATWLKAELQKRFAKPVKYVVYSHNHSDHVYGGEQFASANAIFISHELAAQDLKITKAETALPQITFSDRMNIQLGGHDIELRYHGPNDGRGSISVLFHQEKVVFVVDWIVLGRMPWQKLWSYDIYGMLNSTDQVLNMDFDTFIGGHGTVGTKQDVMRYRNYLSDLLHYVADGIGAGKPLHQIQEEANFKQYQDLGSFAEWLPLNIEGVYNHLNNASGLGWRPKRSQ